MSYFGQTETGTPIGSFVIGQSAIGGFLPFDWKDTVISQYANSPRLLAMIENFNGYIDQTANLDAFFTQMWNIDTAVGYGLDVWGRILGIGRVIAVDSGTYFGFEEALPGSNGFNQQPFYSGPPSTPNYSLSDDAYRLLLLAKAAANITDDSIPAINRLLMALFPNRGNAYVQEGAVLPDVFLGFEEAGGDEIEPFNQAPFFSGQSFQFMTMRYVFKFLLTPVELSIVKSGVLPTPTGVQAVLQVIP